MCPVRSAHEVLRGDTKLLAPEETPEEVIRERQQRAAALAAVQDKLRGREEAAGERLYSSSYSNWSGFKSLTPLWEPNESYGAEITSYNSFEKFEHAS